MTAIEQTAPDEYSRTWGMYAHLAGILTFTAIPLAGVIGPLIIRELVKQRSPFAAEQARNALNFHITTGVSFLACIIGVFVSFFAAAFATAAAHAKDMYFPWLAFVFFALAPTIYIWTFAFSIVGTVRSSRGELYSYPLTIPFVGRT